MICASIQNQDFKGLLQVLESCEMAEVRLDKCKLSLAQIAEVFASDVPLVATCRLGDIPLMKVQQTNCYGFQPLIHIIRQKAYIQKPKVSPKSSSFLPGR